MNNDWPAINSLLKAKDEEEDAPRNRRERRHVMFGSRRLRRVDNTPGTKTPRKMRVEQNRAAAKRASQSRKANR